MCGCYIDKARKCGATLTADIKYFYGDTDTSQKITYSVADEYKAYVSIKDNKDGNCVVEGINNEDEAKEVIIEAATESGLCAATAITVKPSKLTAPSWTKLPEVINNGDGTLKADYKLNLGDSFWLWYFLQYSSTIPRISSLASNSFLLSNILFSNL